VVEVRLERGLDATAAMVAWDALDPDHVALSGCLDRDQPWGVIAPWPPLPPPGGRDAVGDAWREASALAGDLRRDALTALADEHPELVGLAAVRLKLDDAQGTQ
jgi:hypothetical protein